MSHDNLALLSITIPVQSQCTRAYTKPIPMKNMIDNNSLQQRVAYQCEIERNFCQNCKYLLSIKAQRLYLSNILDHSCSYLETQSDRNINDTLLRVTNYYNIIGVMLKNLLKTFRIHWFATICNNC